MARANKLYEKPRVTSLATGDLFTIGQLQADGSYKVKTVTRENARAELLAPIEIEYDDLVALSGSFDTEVSYMITNATAASFNLIVKAVSASEIGCDAKDPLYPNDKVVYNFADDAITWRWDTVRDVSAGEDWRNSNTLSIDDSATKIEIGNDCDTIIIQADCSNIKIGNNCSTITIFAECSGIEIMNNCSNIILSELALYKKICSGIDSYNFATATNFYNVITYAEVRLAQSGSARMNYYDNSNNFVSVAP